MSGGTGNGYFRTIDVGIAEQDAVCMGAGMASKGLKAFACIFLPLCNVGTIK
jgi:deoxyxylulose-5-phosphate synthase